MATQKRPSSSSSKINVLVYSGAGVSQSCLLHLKTALRSLLSTRYDVLSVSAESLIKDPWTSNCALLAFPGGRDLGYLSSLGEIGCKRIADWVRNDGGRYLGLCAGAYFASDRIQFESGREGFEVIGERPLKFFPGLCKGTAFPGFVYDSEDGARDAVITLESMLWKQIWQESPPSLAVYYNGGGFFEDLEMDGRGTVIARYEEVEGRPPAGVLCNVGERGKAVLWAVHPEHPSVASSSAKPASAADEPRTALLRATLQLLDLEVPQETRAITGPTPLLLTSLDADEAAELADNITSKFNPSSSSTYVDLHDTFTVHPQSQLSAVFAKARQAEHNKLDIVVCSQGAPAQSFTPIFDILHFQESLQQFRRTLKFPFRPSFGSNLLYGEVVTSTQTVLDMNPKFLSALPSGFVFVGSHQIAGRGRGSNNWLSPPGCLQFSLVLRVGKKFGPQLVFAQYLFGLAVVEAVRNLPGYEELELRLKWPNDLYVNVGGEEGLKKIGGILVTSKFAGGDFTVIIGCGINTTNSTPTTSLLDLIGSYNEKTEANLPVISQEQLLALILPRFESMWAVFEREGNFQSFADLYRKRWLHSDKVVTIQESGQKVRIVDLTPDYGLLRTVNLESNGQGKEYIDLQPDGNSFDMMQGLLKAKK